MNISIRLLPESFITLIFTLTLLFVSSKNATAQNLTINNTGQTGTSGTNWSISGTNPVTISFNGTSNINTSVIEGYLNSGIDVVISAVFGGGDIVLNSTTISKTQGGDATLTLRARNNVVTFASSIISTAAKLNVIVWVEYDGDQIVGPSVGPITTNGGHIWIGGGSGTSIWNGLTVGNSVAFSNGTSNMNAIDLVGNLTTNGGDVFVAADGTENNSTFGDFVAWNAARTIDAGSGDISLLTEKADFSSSQGHAITLITSGTLTIAPPNSSKKWPGTFSWQGVMNGTIFTGQSSNALGLIINNYTSLTAISIGTYLGTGLSGDNAYIPVTNNEVKDIQINSAISTSKAITIYGLSIYVSANLTTSNAIDGDIYIKGAADIIQGVGDTLRTNGADVVYWADFDGNGGRVEVLSSILTAGGNIWIGGGSSTETQNGLTVPTGYAESVSENKQGVLINGANINSSGGAIRIKGLSDDTGNGVKDLGTMIINSNISSGSGNLSLYGTVNNDLSTGSGLWLGTEINSGVSTGNVTLSTTSGNIYIEGVSAPNNTFTWAHGLMFFATAGDDITISSTTGSISFNGNAVVAANYTDEAVGLVIQMNTTSSTFNVNTDGGAISLTGNGGNSGNDFGIGIRANNIANSIKIGDVNTGKINFSISSLQTIAQSTIGVVGIETSDSVLIEPISTSFGAAISLTDEYALASTIKYLGIGKSGNTANITIDVAQTILGPINIYGGTLNLNANLTSTATTGIGISLNGQKITHAAGVSVITSGSSIEYLVTNSPWTSAADVAIAFSSYSGARATVNAQGGNVTINASFATTGINNSASHQEYGITVSNTDILTNGTGTISINGDIYNNASTTGQFSWGVDLRDGTVIRSASGAINITGRGGKTLANSRGVVSNTTNVQVLSNSGSITFNDLLPTGNANYTGMYFRSSSANAIKIGADGTLVNSSSSDITFNSNRITFDIADIQTSTSGKVFITPEETSFATTFSNTSLNLSSTVSELSIGKIGNNSAIGINRVISIAGPITAYGGTVNVNNNITSTLAGAPISLYSTNDIDPNPASTCTITTNNGNVTVVADADSNGGGNFYLGGAGIFTINSGSGNITLRTEGFSETGLSITSTGSLTIEPSDASFGAGGFTTTWINLPSTLTGLTIGKSTNTNTINFGAGVSAAGPITAYANIINLNSAGGLTTTAANAGIYLYAKENIDGNATQTFTTSNGNVYVIADSDSSGAGTLWFDAITVNIGSGNLIIKGEAISFGGNNINGTGTVTIEPSDNAFGGGIANNGLSLTSTITGLTIGKTTNNTSLTFGTATTISGPITAYGGDITINENLNTTTGGALGDVMLKGTGNISLASTKNITTSGGDVTLWADGDGNGNGYIRLLSNGSITSNGGNIFLGGGIDLNTGYARGSADLDNSAPTGTTFAGVHLNDGATLSSGGGNITLRGQNHATTNSSTLQSAIWGRSATVNSGTGKIAFYALAGGTGGNINAQGISRDHLNGTGWTIRSSNTSSDAIRLEGDASSCNGTYTSLGINFAGTIEATGVGGGIIMVGKAGTANVYDQPLDIYGNILASSGPIEIIGENNNSLQEGIFLSTGATFGFKAGTNVTSSSSNIIFKSSNTKFNASIPINTSGTVSILPLDASNSFGIAQNLGSNMVLNSGVTGFTVGKSTNTANVTISQSQTIAGFIRVYGGDISINENLATTTSQQEILLKAQGFVNLANGRSIQTNGGDVTFWADNDGNGTGFVQLGSSTAITTAGGNITLGGGVDIATGYARGAALLDKETEPTFDLYISGVHLKNGTSLSSGGGNITLRGQNFGDNASILQFGVLGHNATVNAGSGKVGMYGLAGGSGNNNSQAISNYGNGWTIRSSNPNSDAIVLYGDGSPYNGINTSIGINFTGTIESTGGGGVSISGIAGTSTSIDVPVSITGNILANTGDINLMGQNNVTTQTAINVVGPLTLGFKPSTNVTASSSNIILKSDNSLFSSIANINTTGHVSILPIDVSNSFGVTQNLGSNMVLSSGVSGLTVGKSTNMSDITFGSSITIAGPITAYGNNLSLNSDLNTSSGNGNVLLQGRTSISSNSTNRTITVGSGNITFITDQLIHTNSNRVVLTSTGQFSFSPYNNSWTNYGATMNFDGTITSGNYSGTSDAAGLSINNINSLSGFILGKEGNTTGITLSIPINITGPINLYGSSIVIDGAITTSDKITLGATTAVTQTQPITSNGLSLVGAGTFTLNNTSNNITTIAAGTNLNKIGNLSYTDASGGLTIGTVNNPGIYSTGTINIETLSGDLTLSENLLTTNTTSNAIKLFADKNKLAGDGSGGNIIASNNASITVGTGGTAMVYAGKYGLSNGLQRLLTSSYIRYNVDATTSSFSPAIGAGVYGLFREGPFVWNGGSSANHNSGTNWQGNSTPPEGSYIQVSPTATNNIQLNDNWNVGYIDLPAGKMIDLNGYSLTVTGALTGSGKIKGSTTSSLFISGGGEFGTLYMDQTTNGSTNALQNFSVDRINQTITIADTLVIAHNGTVTPTAGTIATGNKLKILSTINGTGRIAQLGSNADITGDVTLQRHIEGSNIIMRGWRMMSIPTTNNAFNQLSDDILVSGPGGVSSGFDIAGSTSSIRLWQESATRGWTSISNTTNTLPAGKGALVFFRGDRTQTTSLTNVNVVPNNVTADYVGPINKGNIIVGLDFANDSTPIYGKGFNLLGNPYPSQIDWENINKTEQIDSYFWVWNPVTKGYVGNSSGIISSGQAFFVRATQSSQSVTFEENDKTAAGTTAYFKTNQELIIKMCLDSVQFDIAWLKFRSGASKNYVFKEDGLKLANTGYNLSFNTINNVAIQHNIVDLLQPNQSDTFVLNVNSSSNSNYTIRFDNLSQIPQNKMLFLKDLYNNSWTDLRANNNYAFTINNNISNTNGNRFLLIITDVYNPLPVNITAFKGERKQHINKLSWNVAQEKNIAYYQVQRSINGNDFTDIGVVKATNSSTAQLYLFNDENATDLDVAYYKLKVIEQNGDFNFSNIVVIHNIKQIALNINVYPIPTKDWINIETNEAILNVKIYDVRGMLIAEKNGQNKFDIDHLQTGVYIMKVETTSGISTHKIIKE